MWHSVSRPRRAEPAPRLPGMSEDFTDGTGLCPHCGHHVAATYAGKIQVSMRAARKARHDAARGPRAAS